MRSGLSQMSLNISHSDVKIKSPLCATSLNQYSACTFLLVSQFSVIMQHFGESSGLLSVTPSSTQTLTSKYHKGNLSFDLLNSHLNKLLLVSNVKSISLLPAGRLFTFRFLIDSLLQIFQFNLFAVFLDTCK